MKKTPLVFVYDYDNNIITDKVKPGSEWVLNSEGIATIKIDGSACLYKDGKLWKRFDRRLKPKFANKFKPGDNPDLSYFREEPEGFVPCEEKPDPNTFHWPGWVPVSEDNPADKYHIEALLHLKCKLIEGKTYELVGPTLHDNPYKLENHELWEHGKLVVDIVPDFESIKKYLEDNYIEGLVFHHKEDGRVAKIRRKDFNLFWIKDDVRKNYKPKKKFKI